LEKECVYELDADDLQEYRRLFAQRECGIMYNVPLSYQEATNIELEMIEFQAYLIKKYLYGQDLDTKDWHIDEILGEIYLWG
jgi:hypothetical protein